MSKQPVLIMRGISKRFGGVRALQDVDFELHAGEVVGLVGDNGAGKSTLLKILAGVYQPTEGEVFIEGEQVGIQNPKHARRLGIGIVYQELSLVDSFDIPSNIFLGREITRWGMLARRRMREEARVVLDSLSIESMPLRKRVHDLSGGQRQAIELSKVVHTNPRILLADEPTAALAVKETRRILDLLIRFKERGIGVVLVSHSMPDVFAVSDRVVVLRRGKKVGDVAIDTVTVDDVVKLIVGAEERSSEQVKQSITYPNREGS